jgi:butyryl-CoA dehydrogenase
MYNLNLNEEQIAIRDTVCDFVKNEITPVALHPDRLEPFDPPLPSELIDQAAELGLRALSVSEEFGGAGADVLTSCIVAEELAVGDADVASVLAETANLAGVLFGKLLNKEQRERFLPAFLEDNQYHIALANSEADSDSWVGNNYAHSKTSNSQINTRAVQDANGNWIINGTKTRISNATVAKLFLVQAETKDGQILLIVPKESGGIMVNEVDRDGGWYIGSCGDIIFTDCMVSAENIIDLNTVDVFENIGISCAINVGVARAAFEAAVEYSKIRIQGGGPIIQHQAIGAKLAEVAISLEVARTIIWRAAWTSDNKSTMSEGNLTSLPLNNIAHISSAEILYKAAKDSAECFGAMGVMRDMPLQKFIHQTRMFLHRSSGNDDSKLQIAEAIAGFE